MAREELVATCQAMDKLTADELIQANRYLRDRLSQIRTRASMLAKYQFQENDKVQFNSKRGVVGSGTITKINRTTASVMCSDGPWRIPLSMLRKVA